ncbi:hypothetical protein Tco_0995882 [Tanacetum coccineum]
MCAICDNGVETSRHLFFYCCMARQIVRKITRWWDVPYVEVESYEDWYNWLVNLRISSMHKQMFEGVFYVMWWHLWSFRNKLIFDSLKWSLLPALFVGFARRIFIIFFLDVMWLGRFCVACVIGGILIGRLGLRFRIGIHVEEGESIETLERKVSNIVSKEEFIGRFKTSIKERVCKTDKNKWSPYSRGYGAY